MAAAEPISRATLDRLIQLGRSRGGLSTDHLRAALPIETMGSDEIALVVAELEDAGVNVEIDPALLAGGPDPRLIRGEAGHLGPARPDGPGPIAADATRVAAVNAPAAAHAATGHDHHAAVADDGLAERAVMIAGAITILIILLITILLRH